MGSCSRRRQLFRSVLVDHRGCRLTRMDSSWALARWVAAGAHFRGPLHLGLDCCVAEGRAYPGRMDMGLWDPCRVHEVATSDSYLGQLATWNTYWMASLVVRGDQWKRFQLLATGDGSKAGRSASVHTSLVVVGVGIAHYWDAMALLRSSARNRVVRSGHRACLGSVVSVPVNSTLDRHCALFCSLRSLKSARWRCLVVPVPHSRDPKKCKTTGTGNPDVRLVGCSAATRSPIRTVWLLPVLLRKLNIHTQKVQAFA